MPVWHYYRRHTVIYSSVFIPFPTQPSVSNITCRLAWVRYSIPVCTLPDVRLSNFIFLHWLKCFCRTSGAFIYWFEAQTLKISIAKRLISVWWPDCGAAHWRWVAAGESAHWFFPGSLSVIGCPSCFHRWLAQHFLKEQLEIVYLKKTSSSSQHRGFLQFKVVLQRKKQPHLHYSSFSLLIVGLSNNSTGVHLSLLTQKSPVSELWAGTVHLSI